MHLSAVPHNRTTFVYRFKHAFTVLLLSFFLTLIVPAGISGYLYRQVVKITENNCIENTLTMLDTAGAELRYKLNDIDNAAFSVIYDTSLRNILYMPPPGDADPNIITFLNFIQKLDDKLGSVSGNRIGYRLFCRGNGLVFYNGAMSSGLRAYFNSFLRYKTMGYAQWLDTIFSTTERTLFPADTIDFGQYAAYALTYSFPITSKTAAGSEVLAALQFFIDVNAINENLTFLSETGSAFLVDADGRVLAHSGDETPYPFDEQSPAGAAVSEYQNDSLFVRSGVTRDLYLIAALPKSYALQSAYALHVPLLICLVLCFALEGVLCLFLARQNALPIERFATNVKPLLPNPAQGSEYTYFERSIAQLRLSQQTTQTALEQNRRLETSLLLNHLFDEDYQDASSLVALASHSGVDLRAQGYCVASIQSEQGSLLMPNDLTVVQAAPGLRCLCYMNQNTLVSFLYFCGEPESPSSYDAIMAHLRQVKQTLRLPVRIGVGRIYPAIEDVAFSFQQSLYCIQQEAAVSDIAIFDTVSRNLNAPYFTLEQQQCLLNAVKHNNVAVIDEQVDRIILENTQKRHLSSNLKKLLISTVEGILIMAAEEVVEEENLSDYLLSIHHPHDIREQMEVLREELKKISKVAEGRFTVRKSTQRKDIQAYLATVYADPSLSAASTAEHFGLSESYFSILFKDLMHEPYSVYIEKLRLSRAKQLIHTSSMSMEEIAVAVGYNNSTTFRRAFKRVAGVSPIQYKQKS